MKHMKQYALEVIYRVGTTTLSRKRSVARWSNQTDPVKSLDNSLRYGGCIELESGLGSKILVPVRHVMHAVVLEVTDEV
jgi:hypothetical protein